MSSWGNIKMRYTCDTCGREDTFEGYGPGASEGGCEVDAEAEGWIIGFKDVCPGCNAEAKGTGVKPSDPDLPGYAIFCLESREECTNKHCCAGRCSARENRLINEAMFERNKAKREEKRRFPLPVTGKGLRG